MSARIRLTATSPGRRRSSEPLRTPRSSTRPTAPGSTIAAGTPRCVEPRAGAERDRAGRERGGDSGSPAGLFDRRAPESPRCPEPRTRSATTRSLPCSDAPCSRVVARKTVRSTESATVSTIGVIAEEKRRGEVRRFDTASESRRRRGRAAGRPARRTGGSERPEERHGEHRGQTLPPPRRMPCSGRCCWRRAPAAPYQRPRREARRDRAGRPDHAGLGSGLLQGAGGLHARRPAARRPRSHHGGEHRASNSHERRQETDGHDHVLGRDAAGNKSAVEPRASAAPGSSPTAEATSPTISASQRHHPAHLLRSHRDGAQQRDLALPLHDWSCPMVLLTNMAIRSARPPKEPAIAITVARALIVSMCSTSTRSGAGQHLGRVRPAASRRRSARASWVRAAGGDDPDRVHAAGHGGGAGRDKRVRGEDDALALDLSAGRGGNADHRHRAGRGRSRPGARGRPGSRPPRRAMPASRRARPEPTGALARLERSRA